MCGCYWCCDAEIIEHEVLRLAGTAQANSNDNDTQHKSSDILDSSKFDLKLDKSNILMLGPTGCGLYDVRLSDCVSWAVVSRAIK